MGIAKGMLMNGCSSVIFAYNVSEDDPMQAKLMLAAGSCMIVLIFGTRLVPQDSSGEHGKSTGEQSDDEEEDARHQAMLEAVSGGTGKRKRKRTDVVVTEAYPESEYNLNPMAASAGVPNHWSSKAFVISWGPHQQACFAGCLLAVPCVPSFALVDKLGFKISLHPVRNWQLSPILLC